MTVLLATYAAPHYWRQLRLGALGVRDHATGDGDGVDNFCLIGTGWCYPSAWWGAAAAWFQAVATVLTFFWALVIQRGRDQRDLLAREVVRLGERECHLRAEANALNAQVEALQESTAQIRTQTVLFRLRWCRVARAHLSAIRPVLRETYASHVDAILAVRELLLQMRDLPELQRLVEAANTRFSEESISLVATIEATTDQMIGLTREVLEKRQDLDLAQIVQHVREVLNDIQAGYEEFLANEPERDQVNGTPEQE